MMIAEAVFVMTNKMKGEINVGSTSPEGYQA